MIPGGIDRVVDGRRSDDGRGTTVGVVSFELDVHVRPGARTTHVGGEHDGVLTVRVAAPPADGQANEAVCRAVATALGVRPTAVELVRGASSRRKRLRIAGDPDELRARSDGLRAI